MTQAAFLTVRQLLSKELSMHSKQVWRYKRVDSQYVLSMDERLNVPIQPDEVRIDVQACSLNYRDLIALRNKAGRNVEGLVPLSDGAGIVTEVGADVKQWKVGDRVAGCFFPFWQDGRFDLKNHQFDLGGNIDGMLAKQVTFNESGIVEIPSHLSFEQAASLPCAGVTVWHALFDRGQLKKGETVLVLGTGGVSMFGLQLATAAGARVIVTSSKSSKLLKAKELGAWETIDTSNESDWSRKIWELTSAKGADHVIETGGPGTLEQSMKSVSAGGQIHLIGVLSGFGPPNVSLFPLLARNVTVHGIYVGSRQHFINLNQFLAQHAIQPVIDRAFAFDDAQQAFEYLESAQHLGKVVIKIQ
jgi:NADPH:quinone reductase-like Zn-dependent oxidoreductase